MKYSSLISFDPIESVIQLTAADDNTEAVKRVKSYVMSDSMAEQIKNNMLSQLSLDDVVDNKGVLLVGNYGTGKSHLMSVISAIALDAANLAHLRNQGFAEDAKGIAGRFEVVRIEIGAVKTPLREIVFSRVRQDFGSRGLTFDYPSVSSAANNKEPLTQMMQVFASKYPDKGYLIVVDEFLDFLGGKDDHAVRLDLGFMRELGEIVKESRLRVIFGVQEKLFDNPSFSFVSQTISRVRDRFEQVVIRKEDTAYVVSERILKKTDEQKAIIRDHLQKFCSLYSNMSERMEEYVNLYPIHPSYIDVFNKIYIIENRHILKNISLVIRDILENEVSDDLPGVLSFDSYWPFIKENFSYRTDPNIKEVVEKSGQLEDIINRSFPKKVYMPVAMKMIYALSVHRLATGDIGLRTGLTSENLRDDLCLYLPGLPDQSSDTLQTLVQAVLKDVMTTVSGQFIDFDANNGQYYLDLKKDVDYDEKITQRAATVSDDSLNNYFFDLIYFCLDWNEQEYVKNFKIYEHTLIWDSHHIFRQGYLFLGKPEDRSTAQPPEDYYVYFLPPYGNTDYLDEKKEDEVFFIFKEDEEFKNNLKLYAAACIMRELAEEKNKPAYQAKADVYRKRLTKFLSENKNTAFEAVYCGVKKQLLEVMKGRYQKEAPFKETMDLVASLLLEPWFAEKYPEFPVFKTTITLRNQAEAIRKGLDRFAGRKEHLGNMLLDSFGLLSGDNITIKDSMVAQYYAKKLDDMPAGTVLNFNDLYQEGFHDYLDKQFQISYALLPIALLGLVYTGRAVITLKNGTVLSASNLDSIPKMTAMDIYEFRHISKPKGLQLGELVRLFEVLGLSEGLIRDEQSRETGVERLIAKTQEISVSAAKAKAKLEGDFSLWGEPLVASHVAAKHKDSIKNVSEMLGNFHTRFNTVAKLNNFTYSMAEVEKLGEDLAALQTVLEYEAFRKACQDDVGYMLNIEAVEGVKERIESAKGVFRKTRDEIAEGKYGETAALEVREAISKAKTAYIDIYYQEHQKRRLDTKGAQHKGDLINSAKYADLKRLAEIEILSAPKLAAISNDLAALKVCTDLTPELMKQTHFCPKCAFQLDGSDPLVKGSVDEIEGRIDALTDEWTKTLLNAVTDPLVLPQKPFLPAEQEKAVDEFIAKKALPEKADSFFVHAVSTLLQGFDTVTVDGAELVDELTAHGPYDAETFKAKIEEVAAKLCKGKDKARLRIIVR
ncbi:MAG: DUF6079 family protein [Lachnospiraceae bacterium]|jgi:hypothetical protein|nr:DUF6079 family protein [Lachnospiraceae bacterium]